MTRTLSSDSRAPWIRLLGCLSLAGVFAAIPDAESARAADEKRALPLVRGIEAQPLRRQAQRVAEALASRGVPLSKEQAAALDKAIQESDEEKCAEAIQKVFDPLCLVGVNINAESRVKVALGPAPPQLMQQGWRIFLVKVHNEAGVTAPLRCVSPNAEPSLVVGSNKPRAEKKISATEVADRWLDLSVFDGQPLTPTLSGLKLEYRLLEIHSRDAGKREAKLAFDVGQGTQDLGFRAEVNVLFDCQPAVKVVLGVRDYDGHPTTGQFVFRDDRGRVYPAMTRRLAPDLFFHEQIYRADLESVMLPPGEYEVVYTRGPEYLVETRKMTVPTTETFRQEFTLKRWIELAKLGWYSGDHHVHAAGCAHYEAPTEGVEPSDMLRHILGEDLNVGCVLSWGPCWYYQKQFFSGAVDPLSTPRYLMRYDVEVSGFPSSHAGHLCLIRLHEDDYPGTSQIEEWPSWDLPILKWGKEQGGVVGFSHSGWGLEVPATSLPTYDMPPFNGIGANEFIVDTTHGVCDFISAVDTPSVWELNIWYHALNCGFTTRISGETDFPCIYGDRVGLGRAYVKLDLGPGQPLNYDVWAQGIRDGRSYCCDGLSHLIDFRVGGLGVGEPGAEGRPSVLAAKAGEKLKIGLQAAALLDEKPKVDRDGRLIRDKHIKEKPYWHVERARVGDTRTVPVELIVNGHSVETKIIPADGSIQDVAFEYTPRQSSWIAVRIFPSSHTNPVFVEVAGKPIRASKKSAQWCLDAVDVCWKQKAPAIRESEKKEAEAAYDFAREAYRRVLAEAGDD